eukprot:1136895-Pelagomonas_calceolata.AAC.2
MKKFCLGASSPPFAMDRGLLRRVANSPRFWLIGCWRHTLYQHENIEGKGGTFSQTVWLIGL